MKLNFTEEQVNELIAAGINSNQFPKRRYGGVSIEMINCTPEFITALEAFAKPRSSDYNGLLQKLSVYRTVSKNPGKVVVKRMDALDTAFEQYLSALPNRWVFNNEGYPMLFLKSVYQPAERDNPASVNVSFGYYHNGAPAGRSLTFHADQLVGGRSVSQLLDSYGLTPEVPELVEQYEAWYADWTVKVEMLQQQFLFKTLSLPTSDDYREWRGRQKVEKLSATEEAVYRVVNDNDQVTHKEAPIRRFVSTVLDDDGNALTEAYQLPIWPSIYVFNLETHGYMWVESYKMTPYAYDLGLVDRLIVPPAHKRLLKLLTEKPDTLTPDFVSGKSGGTIILTHGAPGVGKTMAAEVFSEGTSRILYKVQSEQLGIDVDDIEKNLKNAFIRAIRWNAVLLIDEADIYIRKRGYDIQQNAIVGTILRSIEYFNGICFMATNLGSDVDDAVISRASAVIKFELPSIDDSKAIFRQFAGLFGMTVSEEVIDEYFGSVDRQSGRTIKNVLRLTARMGFLNPTLAELKEASTYVYHG